MPVASLQLPPISASAKRVTTDLGLLVSPQNARLEPFNSKNHASETLALSVNHDSLVEMKILVLQELHAGAKKAGPVMVNCASR